MRAGVCMLCVLIKLHTNAPSGNAVLISLSFSYLLSLMEDFKTAVDGALLQALRLRCAVVHPDTDSQMPSLRLRRRYEHP